MCPLLHTVLCPLLLGLGCGSVSSPPAQFSWSRPSCVSVSHVHKPPASASTGESRAWQPSRRHSEDRQQRLTLLSGAQPGLRSPLWRVVRASGGERRPAERQATEPVSEGLRLRGLLCTLDTAHTGHPLYSDTDQG